MQRLNILVIDDNQDLADGLGMILEDEGHQVTLAYNGIDGINAFDATSFDVALVDVKLPDMNGIEIFQNIHKKDPDIRIFLMTGYRVEQLLEEVVGDADVEIIRNPFEIKHITEAVIRVKNESIILIADDTPDCGKNLAGHLSAHKFKIMLVDSTEKAVADVDSDKFDVLVLDLHKPVTYALEIYLELKQRNNALKTIIVTGCEDKEANISDLLRSTAITGCLFKPFHPEYLLQILDRKGNC